MNEKRNRLQVFFGKTEVKPQTSTISGLKAKAFELYKEVEDRIATDSLRLDVLDDRRHAELIEHDRVLKQVMERHEQNMNMIASEEKLMRDAIQEAQVMKANLAKIA